MVEDRTFSFGESNAFLSPRHSHARYVAMKDSWSHGDDRRDRGRVDRGVTRPRRSRSPTPRRSEIDREGQTKDRSSVKSKPISQHRDRSRELSQDRRRRHSPSPAGDSRDEVRERNRGRELLDTRGSEKSKRDTHHSSAQGKRRKSRSPSPNRSRHRKYRRDSSHSPSRFEGRPATSSRLDKKRHTPSSPPPRRRSPDRKASDIRSEGKYNHNRDFDRRGRSRSPHHDRYESSRQSLNRQHASNRYKSSRQSPAQSPKALERLTSERFKDQYRDRKKHRSPHAGRRSPNFDRYESPNRSSQTSPRATRDSREPRRSTREKEGRQARDDYHPGESDSKPGRLSPAASGANSIGVKAEKMAGRGFYGGQQGYNPNLQMQAAFPLKPQYNQGQQGDPRQYSQSPHMTPNSSFHGSPQAHSPYSAGRDNWNGQQPPQQQYSPRP